MNWRLGGGLEGCGRGVGGVQSRVVGKLWEGWGLGEGLVGGLWEGCFREKYYSCHPHIKRTLFLLILLLLLLEGGLLVKLC